MELAASFVRLGIIVRLGLKDVLERGWVRDHDAVRAVEVADPVDAAVGGSKLERSLSRVCEHLDNVAKDERVP